MTTGSTTKPEFTPRYTNYVLGALLVVYVFNFIDRQILAILAPAIKAELGLSDTQIGALSGIAFGIFYATLGIPIARLADRFSRVNIIAICLVIWSFMTAISGFANNFVQLLIARVGVAVGEAGGTPPSHSLISDYFPPNKRASALGVYALGIPIGILGGNFLGGWISELYGWRAAFFIVGVPGVLIALLLKFTVKEPPRGHSEQRHVEIKQVPFSMVLRTMWGMRSFKYLALGAATQAFAAYGVIAWMPSFLIRAHDMSIANVGMALGVIIGLCGGAGTFLGGVLGDRLGARNVKWYMWMPAICFLVALPLSVCVFLSEDLTTTLVLYAIPVFLLNVYTAPTLAMTQNLAPLAMRAAASALLFFIMNLIGLALGPTVVGILSDVLQNNWQINAVESLRWALIVCNCAYFLSVLYYFLAARTLEADLALDKVSVPDNASTNL
ncbi:MAG: spinster family MFS transporter [Pseudomonadales bacterium]